MKKLLCYSFLLLFSLSACNKDDDSTTTGPVDPLPTTVKIAINSPSDGASLDLMIPVSIQVAYTRENDGLISKVKIEILDVTGAVLETLVDDQVDRLGSYSFNQINGFMGSQEGAYRIRATATDANGGNEVTITNKFTLE
ncbi:MAG: hypothetical protein AB8G15_12560 [Saprospiraceae bacterium]